MKIILKCREKFGLHSVDFNDPERPRTPKASSKYLKEIITNNGFIQSYDDDVNINLVIS